MIGVYTDRKNVVETSRLRSGMHAGLECFGVLWSYYQLLLNPSIRNFFAHDFQKYLLTKKDTWGPFY